MSKRLTAAGYDPTNIEERARVIAKARGLVGDTRKRDVEEMEEDDEDAWEGEGDESMEVDGDDSRTAKRAKSTIVPKGKRIPGTDRQTAGLGSTQEAAKAVKKSEFALKQALAVTDWVIPRYISEGLLWLAAGDTPATVGPILAVEVANV